MSDLFQGPFSSSSDALNIQARSSEHEAIINRQGQLARIISVQKCPCIKNGKPDIFCTICRGFGYIFGYQKTAIVVDENSPHYGCKEIFPKATPLLKVYGVQKVLHESQGGLKNYTVENFTQSKIEVEGPCYPKRYEMLRVTYEYSLEQEITNEDCGKSGYILTTTGTKIDDIRNSSNPFEIHGDITEVIRVYNVTQDITYSVKNYFKQNIIIDDIGGTVFAPNVDDILEVDYKYIKPINIGTGRITVENSLNVWGEDIKEGDVEGIIPGYYYIGKGDIITLLAARLKQNEVIQRGASQKDELPQFDVEEIYGNIIDEDGNEYDNTKFHIEQYNDLVWEAGQGPSQGKKYTVSFIYRPSFRIYKQNINMMTNENKRFPHQVMLRYMNRFNKKEFLLF